MNRFTLIFIICVFFGLIETNAASPSIWQRRVSVQWTGTALGESLSRFAEVQKFGLLIDRRIDPSIPLHFESTNQSLEQIFRQLAESLDLGYVLLDSTVYLGPKDTVEILPNLLAINRKRFENLSTRRATMFRRKTSLKISFLSEPGDVLQNLAKQNSFRWKNPEILPHDLWNEKSFVNLTLDELLTILLIGFEMTFEIENDGETFTLVPLPKNLVAVPSATDSKNEVPSTDLDVKKIPLDRRRFTLKVEEQRLDILLQTLAKQLDRTLELDENSLTQKGILPDSRVSFDIKNATVAQLFQVILRPLKLDFRIKDDSIRVW